MGLNLRIRALRLERNLTLELLAGRIGVTAAHLSQVERGKRNLNNHLLNRLASALEVEPSELIASEQADDVARLSQALAKLSPEDRTRVETFALALLRSQQEPPQT